MHNAHHTPVYRMYGEAEFRIPTAAEKKTLLLTPGEGEQMSLTQITGGTKATGEESITSQPWLVPALVLTGVALVAYLYKRN